MIFPEFWLYSETELEEARQEMETADTIPAPPPSIPPEHGAPEGAEW